MTQKKLLRGHCYLGLGVCKCQTCLLEPRRLGPSHSTVIHRLSSQPKAEMPRASTKQRPPPPRDSMEQRVGLGVSRILFRCRGWSGYGFSLTRRPLKFHLLFAAFFAFFAYFRLFLLLRKWPRRGYSPDEKKNPVSKHNRTDINNGRLESPLGTCLLGFLLLCNRQIANMKPNSLKKKTTIILLRNMVNFIQTCSKISHRIKIPKKTCPFCFYAFWTFFFVARKSDSGFAFSLFCPFGHFRFFTLFHIFLAV